MHLRRNHVAVLVLLSAAVLVALVSLLARAWFEAVSGVLDSDALLFQTVGRGILNGFTPYTDLFENKPPGVFLLSALSWKVFGSQVLVKLAQAVVLLGIPVAVLLPALSISGSRPPAHRRVISLVSLLFGLHVALYTASMAGLGLAESYGAFFGVWFLAAAVTRKHWAILGLLLLCAVGFKEPFLLSILAGALVLYDRSHGESFVRVFADWMVKPLVVAVVLGVAALWVLGYFDAFFGTYLPYMLGYHVSQSHDSLLLRSLEVSRLFANMQSYSLFFALSVVLLWLSLLTTHYKLLTTTLLRLLAATYIALIAIGTGGDFYGHHFVFAVPFFAALYWSALHALPHNFWERRMWQGIVSVFAVLLMVASFASIRWSYAADTRAWQEQQQELRHAATVVDTVMQRCGWDRYLQMMSRDPGPYAYTMFSPYGPVFIHYDRQLGASEEFQKSYVRALQQTKLMVLIDMKQSRVAKHAQEYIGVHFAKKPPACAGADFVQPAPYTILFRRDA